jgi:tetratricopeptide (TPR) repeat protein
VLSKINDDKTVYIARGIVYYDMGNSQLGLADFMKAKELGPDNAEAYFRMGLCKLKEKSYNEAIKYFNEARLKESLSNNSEKNPGI